MWKYQNLHMFEDKALRTDEVIGKIKIHVLKLLFNYFPSDRVLEHLGDLVFPLPLGPSLGVTLCFI